MDGDINEPSILISSDGAGMQVIKGDRARVNEVDGMIVRWVREQNSVPGFFASWILY